MLHVIERVHHVAYVVGEMDPALERFEAVFGIEPVHRAERSDDEFELETALYPAGEGLIEFISPTVARGWVAEYHAAHGDGFFHLGYEVDDLDAAIDRLRAAGVGLVTDEPQSGVGGAWSLVTIDEAETIVPTQLVEDHREDRSDF